MLVVSTFAAVSLAGAVAAQIVEVPRLVGRMVVVVDSGGCHNED